MKLPRLDSGDRRWLYRWLRGHLVCVGLLFALVLALQLDTSVRELPHSHAGPTSTRGSAPLTPLGTRSTGPQSAGISVLPDGWRRTAQGWEHVSSWRAPRPSLDQVILGQIDREPAWIRAVLAWLRSLSPLTFAAIQLAAISVAIVVGNTFPRTPRPTVSGSFNP